MRPSIVAFGLLVAGQLSLFSQAPALQTREQNYRLQPGDSVEVQYRYTPEYNAKAFIQPDGLISLPITGSVRLGGLTVNEARAAVAAKAGERLREPEVTVLLTDFVKPSFTVAGEVARPGRYDLRGATSAIDAVALSGGFKDSSKHSQVILVRRLNDEFADVRLLNMKIMMRFDGVREDIRVQDGDLLIVPQNMISKVERIVRWGTFYAAFGNFIR
jgi:polysaccharide export outer membrane protein